MSVARTTITAHLLEHMGEHRTTLTQAAPKQKQLYIMFNTNQLFYNAQCQHTW